MPLKFKELFEAFDLSDERMQVRVNLLTGQTHLLSDYDQLEDLPDDIDDDKKYFQLPDKKELGLGKPLALLFASEHMPDDLDRVRDYFRSRGAYARFKDLIDIRGKREAWFAFETEAQRRALRAWCEANEIEVMD